LAAAVSVAFVKSVEDANDLSGIRGPGVLNQDLSQLGEVLRKEFVVFLMAGKCMSDQATSRIMCEKLVEYCAQSFGTVHAAFISVPEK
jgi:hypothetical protein